VGHGRLRARRVEVTVAGRRGAVRPRTAELWLPGPEGQVALAAPAPAPAPALARTGVDQDLPPLAAPAVAPASMPAASAWRDAG
jgi:hypothetical protein